MGSKWTSTTVGKYLDEFGGEIKTGPFGTKLKASEYSDEGVPVISVGEVQSGSLVVHDRTPKVDSTVTSRMPEYLLEEGDIVFGRKGAVERSARVQKNQNGWFLGSDGIRLRLSKTCNSLFVSYQFQSNAHKYWMIQNAAGTTMASLNERIIKRIPLVLPPISIQNAIAHILGTLDDKIELNRQMNATLEAMAQAVFKSWFVDFDPVIDKALAAGNPIPDPLKKRAAIRRELGDKRKPLPEAIEAHFPDHFVYNDEMGWVPGGWEVTQLEKHLDVLNGYAFKSKDYSTKGVFVLRTKNFDTFNVVERLQDDVYLPAHFSNSHSKYLCQDYDYHLIMVGASVGNRGLIQPHQLPALRNQNMWCFRPKVSSFVKRVFVKYMLDILVQKKIGLASGSAREFFRKGDFTSALICIGNSLIQGLYSELAFPTLEKQAKNSEQSEELSNLRDFLLPKLLSGELRIPDAEKLVEDAV